MPDFYVGKTISKFDIGYATQGKMKPSFFSSKLNPGHSMRYLTSPSSSWQIQVRQVPFRHELLIGMPAASLRFASSSACSTVADASALIFKWY